MARIKIDVNNQRVIFHDIWAYSAHPHAVLLANGEIVVVFNQTVRRKFILHPPEDPRYINFIIRSKDGGKTWSTPRVVPGYNWSGMECSGFTVVAPDHLIINQWQFSWLTVEEAQRNESGDSIALPAEWLSEMTSSCELEDPQEIHADPNELAPWARGGGKTYVHHSYDHGRTWEKTVQIDTGSYSGGYGMRGAAILDDGTIFLPMSDVPHYQKVFAVRSKDGYDWEKPNLVAAQEGLFFEEPCPFVNERGQLVVLLRENTTRSLYQVRSNDNGDVWTRPRPVGVNGYPADVARLKDGRFLMVFGRRTPPMGIFAVVSHDGSAEEWDVENEWSVDAHFPNKNIGYPSIVRLSDSEFLVVYYGEDDEQNTCLWGADLKVFH